MYFILQVTIIIHIAGFFPEGLKLVFRWFDWAFGGDICAGGPAFQKLGVKEKLCPAGTNGGMMVVQWSGGTRWGTLLVEGEERGRPGQGNRSIMSRTIAWTLPTTGVGV
jgi:hypothetical protein